MEEGGEGINGILLVVFSSFEIRLGMLVLWLVELFFVLFWFLFCLVLFFVGYFRNVGQEDFFLIVIDFLGRVWFGLGFWDEGGVGGIWFFGGGGFWFGLREEVVFCRQVFRDWEVLYNCWRQLQSRMLFRMLGILFLIFDIFWFLGCLFCLLSGFLYVEVQGLGRGL